MMINDIEGLMQETAKHNEKVKELQKDINNKEVNDDRGLTGMFIGSIIGGLVWFALIGIIIWLFNFIK